MKRTQTAAQHPSTLNPKGGAQTNAALLSTPTASKDGKSNHKLLKRSSQTFPGIASP